MAVANVAWILATQRHRVLVIDWDLEAPGLHRYFRPFLDDPELSETDGLINFLSDFAEGASLNEVEPAPGTNGAPWYEKHTDLLRYAVPLHVDLGPNEPELAIDFIPAGRQGASYAALVSGFQWGKFYERLGGGVFLEAVKERLRTEYDFILIDSRTGLSDTAGICTVQMPDDLFVCFTLNQQSIYGAAAVAQSALSQRRRPDGSPSLNVWPVPTRVELAESRA